MLLIYLNIKGLISIKSIRHILYSSERPLLIIYLSNQYKLYSLTYIFLLYLWSPAGFISWRHKASAASLFSVLLLFLPKISIQIVEIKFQTKKNWRMLLYPERVLSSRELKKLGEHKYSSSCQSLLDPAMQKFWNW